MRISEAELLRMRKWTPNEPFADVPAMRLVIPLSDDAFVGFVTTRQAPGKHHGMLHPTRLERLPIRMLFKGAEPIAVVTFNDGAAWLRAICQGLPAGMEFGLMKSACWRLSCRVSRGSRERTQLAKLALRCYRDQWPHGRHLARQPGGVVVNAQEQPQ